MVAFSVKCGGSVAEDVHSADVRRSLDVEIFDLGSQSGATVQLTRQKGKITKGKVRLPVLGQKFH